MRPLQKGQKALEPGFDLAQHRSVTLGPGIRKRRIPLQGEEGILGAGPDVFEPHPIHLPEEPENLLRESLLGTALGEDQESLELVL
ncbi:MAG TPA: hypothetical protein VF414_10730, partial [Thermoanaerobaculia bacterium]